MTEVNVGSAPNDNTGDPLRIAFIKINNDINAIKASLSAIDELPDAEALIVARNAAQAAAGTATTAAGTAGAAATAAVEAQEVVEEIAAVASFVQRFTTLDAMRAATIPGNLAAVGGVLYQTNATGPVVTGGGKRFGPAWFVTPAMFGAVGDGVADDRAAVQAAWDYAGLNHVPCIMEGLEYNCSDAVFTSSNLTVLAGGAVMYVTAWPLVGGFITNVRPVVAERVQSNIRIYDLITDGSKLPAPTSTQNTNIGPSFARGASNVRIVNCTGRKCRDGFGSGTGGNAFGGEQGLHDVQFWGCVAEDCFRAVRVAGIPGEHSPGVSKEATGIVFRDLVVRRCGTAIFCHSVGEPGDDQSDIGVFDVLFDGVYIEDCGHYPWREFDFTVYPTIPPQKTGAIVFGGAQNIRMRGVRVKTNAGFPSTFTDWLGRTGYPASGNFIGAGLSGPIGALVWGWGRNIVIEDITLDGSCDAYWNCSRSATFGDIGSVAPTNADGTVEQVVFESIRHVRPGIYNYVYDGHSGMDNAKFSARMTVTPSSAPTIGVLGPGGTASLTNLLVQFVANNGATQQGNAAEWLAAGNVRPTSQQRRHEKGGYDVGGGFSATGERAGQTYDPAGGVLRSSQNLTTTRSHLAFYNPNGLIGSIQTNGSATNYVTSSDARLKSDFRDFDGLGIVGSMQVYDFEWTSGGRSVGAIAQQLIEVVPDAVREGDDNDTWNALGVEERTPWQVDYSKLVPYLIKAVQQLSARLDALENRNGS